MEKIVEYSAEILLVLATLLFAEAKTWVKEKVKSRKSPKTDIASLMRKKNDIENYCVVILDQTKASHVAVWRFHNGNFYAGGDSIKKMSIYTEAALTDGLLVDDQSQQLDLENFSKAVSDLLQSDTRHLQLDSRQSKDWHCNKLMAERSYKTMFWILLQDPQRNPLGILEISYMGQVDYNKINSVMLTGYKQELEFKIENKFAI